MPSSANSACPGCGLEIGSGLLWLSSSGKASLCCNKRCATRAQRSQEALLAGKKPRRRPRTAPPAHVPVEVETGWGSLCSDVLVLLGRQLGVRDCTTAALACKHWGAHLTTDVVHLDLTVDDVSSPEARRCGAAASIAMLDSARAMMPQVASMAVTVMDKCWGEDCLLRHVHALTKWTHVRHMRVQWAVATPCAEEPHAACATELHAPKGSGLPRKPLNTVLDAMCVGALGRLTGLESLSLTARFSAPLKLFGLSSLQRLTALKLLQAEAATLDLETGSLDTSAELASLTSLRSLSIHNDLVPPDDWALLTGLTRLCLEHSRPQWSEEGLTKALAGMLSLRAVRISAAALEHERVVLNAESSTSLLLAAARGLSLLAERQLARQEQQREQGQELQAQAQRRQPEPAGPRQARAAAPAGASAASSSAAEGPAAVHLDFDAAPILLDEQLIGCLAGIVGLRHLQLVLDDGSATNMSWLSELTALTHLSLQCRPACRPRLDAWDMYGLATACSQLRTLVLHLPAECLPTGALEALRLAPCLTTLELCAHPHVRETPYGRWEVRARLLEVAVRQCAGSGSEGAAAGAEGGGEGSSGGGGAAAEVGRALVPLMFLQQVLLAVPLEEVQQALAAEAEWRAQAAQVARDLAAEAAEAAEQQQLLAAAQVVEQAATEQQQQQQQAEGLGEGDAAAAPEPAAPALDAAAADVPAAVAVGGPPAAAGNGPAAAADDGPAAATGDGPAAAAGDGPAAAAGDGPAAAAGDGPAAAAVDGPAAAAGDGPAAAAVEGVAAAAVVNPAAAAGADAAAAAGVGAAAGAGNGADVGSGDNVMPTLAAWALLSPEEEGPDAAAFAAAHMFGQGPVSPVPQPPATALHLLTHPQLAHLRKLLVREELVTGPCFDLERCVPHRTRRLVLHGFSGLCAGGGSGRVAAACLPALEALEAVLLGAGAVEAAREAVAGWGSDGSRAPRLRAISIGEVSG